MTTGAKELPQRVKPQGFVREVGLCDRVSLRLPGTFSVSFVIFVADVSTDTWAWSKFLASGDV